MPSDPTPSVPSVNAMKCADCGSRNPYLIGMGDGRMVCDHRYACEARQMLADGVPVEEAAARAQKRRPW